MAPRMFSHRDPQIHSKILDGTGSADAQDAEMRADLEEHLRDVKAYVARLEHRLMATSTVSKHSILSEIRKQAKV